MNKAVKEFADHYSLLDSLIAEDAPPVLEETDITAKRVARRAKCHHQRARIMIERWVTEGKAEYIGKRREPERGQRVDAWRLVKGKE